MVSGSSALGDSIIFAILGDREPARCLRLRSREDQLIYLLRVPRRQCPVENDWATSTSNVDQPVVLFWARQTLPGAQFPLSKLSKPPGRTATCMASAKSHKRNSRRMKRTPRTPDAASNPGGPLTFPRRRRVIRAVKDIWCL